MTQCNTNISEKFALSPSKVTLATLMRLGLPIHYPECINKCDCRRPSEIHGEDVNGFHLITCKTGCGQVWTHDSMMSVWSECLSSLHLPHKCELRYRYMNSNNRPDILVADSETDSNIELDVALARLWAADISSHASTTAGSAAVRRKELKLSKYEEKKLPGGYSSSVVPLHFDHFGEKEPQTTLMQFQVCGEMRTDEKMLLSLRHNGRDGFQFNCNVAMKVC